MNRMSVCPLAVSVIASFQGVLLVLTPMVTAVTTTALVAGQSDAYLIWAAFAAFLICGIITALQAARVWRFGTGHVLLTAASVSLIVVSVPRADGRRTRPALRRYRGGRPLPVCPVGVAATAAPGHNARGNRYRLDAAGRHGHPHRIGPRDSAAGTGRLSSPGRSLVSSHWPYWALLGLRVSGGWRLWVPIVAIGAGCVASIPFGLYDFRLVAQAQWVGVPGVWFPDFQMPEASAVAALMPIAIIVLMINGIKNMGDSVVVQRLSRRSPPGHGLPIGSGVAERQWSGSIVERSCRVAANDHQLGDQRLPCEPYRSRQPKRGVHRWGHAHIAGILSQVDGLPADHTRPGHGGLPAGRHGHLHSGGNSDCRTGWSGP